ncbi:DNA packaging protein from bacteriophage origin [Escherichia coli]|nr:DNA packaging protein from bacteriophage origin [Escherichia coli]
MTKDELIARLRSLGEQLNRDVSLTGTKEELALRVAELEGALQKWWSVLPFFKRRLWF